MPDAVSRPAVVLFDLGGVLVDFGGVDAMQQLAGIVDEAELWDRWLTCRWVRAFERGSCSAEAFAAGVVADWALPVSPEEFLSSFRAWVGAPLDGADDLVADVAGVVPVGCLSNTNPEHWAVAGTWPLCGAFAHRFLSFEVGLVKPDAELFDHVRAALGVEAGSIVFLDDNQMNIDAANAAGFCAHRTRGVDEARAALENVGILATH